MALELQEGQGKLFARRNVTGKQPTHDGEMMINGELIPISAWVREDKNGNAWVSFQVDEYKQKRGYNGRRRPPENDDDIRF